MNTNKKIAIFDSGFGGLSVLKKIIEKLPNENYIYFADAKHAPYGRRTEEEVLSYCENAFDILFSKNIKALIIACNTSSALFLNKKDKSIYKNKLIYAIHPEIKEAIENTNSQNILLMATKITCKSSYVHNEIAKYCNITEINYDTPHYITKSKKNIYILPAHEIVPFVENGTIESNEFIDFLTNLLSPYKNIDSIILGCTHFPFVKKQINQVYAKLNNPNKIQYFDNAISLSNLISKDFNEKNLTNIKNNSDSSKHTIEIIDTSKDHSRLEMYKSLTNNTNFDYIMI